jgi:hypothetical protein
MQVGKGEGCRTHVLCNENSKIAIVALFFGFFFMY